MKQTLKVGIIGGGQLGQMLCQAAKPLSFKVMVLDPTPNCPASQVGAKQIVDSYTGRAITKLASQCDYLTTEFEEGLDTDLLEKISSDVKFNPAPKSIALILDKVVQKDYLRQRGVNMGEYCPFSSTEEAYQLLNSYGNKMLIKTRRGGYDGYGNRLVSDKTSIDQAMADFSESEVYAEAYVPFVKELAVMAVRSSDGKIITYPVVETIQKNNICHQVLAPAQVEDSVRLKAEAMANNVAQQFGGAGAYGIEMFLLSDGQIYLNEVAPRVHNSGHYSIEACQTSQFTNHLLAISGRQLGSSDMKLPYAVMINLLGERNGPAEAQGVELAEQDEHTRVHIYGKAQTKIGRKMGHITSTGDTLQEAQMRAETAVKLISI